MLINESFSPWISRRKTLSFHDGYVRTQTETLKSRFRLCEVLRECLNDARVSPLLFSRHLRGGKGTPCTWSIRHVIFFFKKPRAVIDAGWITCIHLGRHLRHRWCRIHLYKWDICKRRNVLWGSYQSQGVDLYRFWDQSYFHTIRFPIYTWQNVYKSCNRANPSNPPLGPSQS